MDITFWIAIIGCLTGIVSLCIECARYLSERPKVDISTFNELNNLIHIDGDIVRCYLHLRIINIGRKHILVKDVYMRKPNTAKNIFDNLVHYNRVFASIPWRTRNRIKVREKPQIVPLPVSIPAGGLFEACFVFNDIYKDYYNTEDHFVYTTLLIGFTSNKIKECKIQALVSDVKNEYLYSDQDGVEWGL